MVENLIYEEELRNILGSAKISGDYIFTGGKPMTVSEKIRYNIGLIKDFIREYKEDRMSLYKDGNE